jgi:succinoglycan biosynthesis protein ExoW
MRRRRLPQLGQLAQWAWRDPKILRSAVELAVAKIAR